MYRGLAQNIILLHKNRQQGILLLDFFNTFSHFYQVSVGEIKGVLLTKNGSIEIFILIFFPKRQCPVESISADCEIPHVANTNIRKFIFEV